MLVVVELSVWVASVTLPCLRRTFLLFDIVWVSVAPVASVLVAMLVVSLLIFLPWSPVVVVVVWLVADDCSVVVWASIAETVNTDARTNFFMNPPFE